MSTDRRIDVFYQKGYFYRSLKRKDLNYLLIYLYLRAVLRVSELYNTACLVS